MIFVTIDGLDRAVDALLAAEKELHSPGGDRLWPNEEHPEAHRMKAEALVKHALSMLHGAPYAVVQRAAEVDVVGELYKTLNPGCKTQGFGVGSADKLIG